MLAQLCAVWMTYRTRKILWLLAGIYFLVAPLAWISLGRGNQYALSMSLFRPYSFTTKEAFNGTSTFRDWQQPPSELRKLKDLEISGSFVISANQKSNLHRHQPKEFLNGVEKSKSVVDSQWTAEHSQKLQQCTELTMLNLSNVDLKPEAMNAIGSLSNLTHLSLTPSNTFSLENLPVLPNLRALTLKNVLPHEIGLLKKQPKLRLLALQDFRFPSSDSASPATKKPATLHELTKLQGIAIELISKYDRMVEEGAPRKNLDYHVLKHGTPVSREMCVELSQLPNLQHVSVHANHQFSTVLADDDGVKTAVEGRTPAVWLNPRYTTGKISNRICFDATTAAILILIGIQLFSQLAQSKSLTIPNFARSHLLFASLLLLGHFAWQIVAVQRLGYSLLLPAMVQVTIFPAVASCLFIFASRRCRWLPMVCPLLIMYCQFSMTSGSVVEWFLGPVFVHRYSTGEYPALTLAILLANVVAMVVAMCQWPRLARTLSEQGVEYDGHFASFSKDVFLLNQKRKQESKNKQRVSVEAKDLQDRQIEKISNPPDGLTWLNQLRRWRAGDDAQTTSFRGTILGMLRLLLLASFCLFLGYSFKKITITPNHAVFILLSCFIAVAPMRGIVFARAMWIRRTLIGHELLRPMTRSTMNRMMIWSFWIDMRLPIVMSLIGLIAISQIPDPLSFTSQESQILPSTLGCMCVVATIGSWLTALFLITVRKWYIGGVVAALLVVAAICCFQWIIGGLLFHSFYVGWAPWLIALFGILFGILGVIGARRLPHVEWGCLE